MQLNYRTRSRDASPQGKPRVYFCSHPEDHDAYFEQISREILKQVNCAVFYDADAKEEGSPAERESILAGMQLFVMPVTSRLLRGENRGLRDLQVALANHVPVLPLMQESGLEPLFNRICGELQFLDSSLADETAIAYEKKLQNFLDSVLVGDETAKSIRAAFSAYIFLSYRKKDRAHAQRLMRLIHKSKSCRDLAIWYDEFLMPGENFNTSIDEALEKSSLFLLAVTPNLVKEPNYVRSVEYPRALECGKLILPVELSATDRGLLQEQYCGLPPVIAEADESELARQLAGLFPGRKQEKHDPDRDFFIARAYLDGVDVEVDHAIALEMLLPLAEKGHLRSMETLASMYKEGKGVAKDLSRALHWQNKLICGLERDYRHGHISAEDFLNELYTLEMLYHQVRDYPSAAETAERMRQVASGWQEAEPEEREAAEWVFLALNEQGDCCEALFDPPGARACYEQALDVAESLFDRDESETDAMNICKCYSGIGDSYEKEEDYRSALLYYAESTRILEELFAAGGAAFSDELFFSYVDMYNIACATDELSQAREYCDKLSALAARAEQEPDELDPRDLFYTVRLCQGDLLSREGDSAGSEECYLKMCALQRELVKENESIGERQRMGAAYSLLASSEKALQKLSDYEHYTLESLAIREALADEHPIPEMLHALRAAYMRTGDMYNEINEHEKALEYHERSLALASQLAEENPTAAFLTALADCHMSLGYDFWGYFDGSDQDHFEKGLQIMESLHKKLDSEQSLNALALYYGQLGEIYSIDRPRKSRAYLEKALKIRESYYKKHDTPGAARAYAESLVARADSLYEDDLDREAEDSYKKALQVYEKLLKRTKDIKTLRGYADCVSALGGFYVNLEKPEKAVACYKARVSVMSAISEDTESLFALEKLVSAATMLGLMQEELEQYRQAQDAFLLAFEGLERLEKHPHGSQDPFKKRDLCKYLGRCSLALGETEQAIAYYKQYSEVSLAAGEDPYEGEQLVAEALAEEKRYREAAEQYSRAAALEKEFRDPEGSDYRKDYCKARVCAGDCYRFAEDYPAAILQYEEALTALTALANSLFAEARRNETAYREEQAYQQAHPEEESLPEDEAEYEDYAREVDDYVPEDEDYDFYEDFYETLRDLSLTAVKAALCHFTLEDKESAADYYRYAKEISLRLVNECDDLRDRDRLAYTYAGLGGCGEEGAYAEAYRLYSELALLDADYQRLADDVKSLMQA